MPVLNNANNILLGVQSVQSVYLGNTLVWSSTANILERLNNGFVRINSLPVLNASISRESNGTVTVSSI